MAFTKTSQALLPDQGIGWYPTTMSLIRPPAVAGAFYADDPTTLSQNVQGYLNASTTVCKAPPKAIIAPHAGYIYSGAVAASVYGTLIPLRHHIKRVVLLGPCHRVPVLGMALCSADSYLTPLGPVPVDHGLDQTLLAQPGVNVFDAAHGPEHSLEVHLPFLQIILDQFKVLPLVVGDANPQDVANVLEQVWGGPETLIVISSDLSHFLDYEAAQKMDQRTCAAIEAFNGTSIAGTQACGHYPVKGLLEMARRRHMTVKTLDLRNSGDTAGPKDRVVGYGAWAFWDPQP